MTIFYHVSTFMLHDGRFEPRVPKNRIGEMEDSTVPRICVSPTLEECFTALPHGGDMLKFNMSRRGIYKVYRIDTEKLGISEEDIVTDEELCDKKLVPDAKFTREHWILKEFHVSDEDTMVIILDAFQMELQQICVENDLKNRQFAIIHSLRYRTHEVVPGETIQLACFSEKERDHLEKILKNRVTNIVIHRGNIKFVATGNENMKEIYTLHYCIAYAVDNNMDL